MPFEELIETLKHQYETDTGWGDSSSWTNQDFINLSERIHERTGVTLSHVTLKRIWGKVKYDSLPNTYTLDTLAHYIGFESWRSFVTSNKNNGADVLVHEPVDIAPGIEQLNPGKPSRKLFWVLIPMVLVAIAVMVPYLRAHKPTDGVPAGKYSFSSKKVVTSGLPNSVIFNYDATSAPGDSVIIQQSWDVNLRAKVSKKNRQHTSIYYYPDFYKAKLIVNNQIVKQHELLIQSDGWLGVVSQDPVPVYFDQKDIMLNGKMTLPADSIVKRNIKMQPNPPYTVFSNVKDFGEIYSDDFEFETVLKNDYRVGAAICQQSNIYILCKGTAVGIPLCAKGCISAIDFFFTNYTVSGKKADLSAFGVDFSKPVKIRVVSHNKKAQIFADDQLIYAVDKDIIHSKIIGIDFRFQGTGSVDYVQLSNGKVNYEDRF